MLNTDAESFPQIITTLVPMRWGSSGNNDFGVGASAYTLASRDENASYYYYQEPTVPSSDSALGISHPGQVRGILHAKKPPDKRQTRIGGKTRSSRPSRGVKTAGEPATDCTGSESTIHPPIIVCAGKSVYGSTKDAIGNNERSDTNQHSGEFSGRSLEDWLVSGGSDSESNCNNRPLPQRSARTIERSSGDHSPPQYRTDEELEQIIRDLRDQVFQQQKKQNLARRINANNAEDRESHTHQRKHLKNPVEKMEGAVVNAAVAASTESSLAAPNGLLLQRPLSSSCLNRLVMESTMHMVVPAVIYEAPSAPVRAGIDSKISGAIGSRPSARCRPGSSPAYHPGSKLALHLGDMAHLNPRQLRSKKFAGSTRIRGKKEASRYHDQHELSSDSSESFLYLVDVDETEDGPESLSLSPVGPWAVDDFPSAGIGTATPRSPSASTCHSVSSFGSDDIDNGDGAEWSYSELAALSPRSRLLYFSACVDDCETSRGSISQAYYRQTLRRSATSASGLISKLETQAAKPMRCSSAKATARARSRPGSSITGSMKQKAASRAHQMRKRPQSGGAVSPGINNNSKR